MKARVVATTVVSARARAPGRPKPGSIASGDRLLYTAGEGLS
jgi:hypothetical protein